MTDRNRNAGFTLLEVMIALAIVAIALVSLLGLANRSIAVQERLQRQMVNIATRRFNLMGEVRRFGRISFTRLIADCQTRLEAIVTFMAILDLLKTEDLRAEQISAFGEILLTPGNPPTPQSAASSA